MNKPIDANLLANAGRGAQKAAPWSWLVAAPAWPAAVLEVAHHTTRDQVETIRRACKDRGQGGDIDIQWARPPRPWGERFVRQLARLARRPQLTTQETR